MDLLKKVQSFPQRPGVYWMKDAEGGVLYVGKAKDLRSRIQSYFRKESKSRYQIDFLMRRVADIEYLVTDNEKEALLLENNLIKKYRPRYNIHLKDDKSYASLKLNAQHPFPGLFVTRHIVKDGSLYFGPYASAGALRQTVDLLTKHFKLRTCSDHEFANRSRPCLEYHIGRCSAPCVEKVSKEAYAKQIKEAKLFLEGKKRELVQILKERMQKASSSQSYEEAARLRDLIFYVEETLKTQKVASHEEKNYDALGLARDQEKALLLVLFVRQGNLIDRQSFVFTKPLEEDSEMISHFLLQYYGTVLGIPKEILLPIQLKDSSHVETILSCRLLQPKRGEKAKMITLAIQNAKSLLKASKPQEEILSNLKERLSLIANPRVIECVDISNFQGKEAVGSLVCFEEGHPLKNRYRRFKIRLSKTPNDYAMMAEVLSRRFKRALQAGTPEEKEKWELPDLLLVDGGKGQLGIAKKVLADLGLHGLAVAAIAKAQKGEKGDKVYIPGRMNPITLSPRSKEILYLMKIRDEAHRFGIAYHRKLRSFSVAKF